MNDLDGSNGFILNGIDAKDRAGISVSTAGDINGDGIEDLIVGAQLADPVNPNNTSRVLGSAGEVYVIFGQNDYGKREFELADLNMDGELRGFKVDGLSGGDQLGRSVSSAGDVNGDGYDDLLLGAPNGDPLDDTSSKISNAGETYVIFGGDFDGLQTQLGTAEDDILQGSPGADVMVGRIGADTLLTAGGEDVAYGGAGNDIINIIDTSFIRLEGGPGRDTLQWNNDQTLDFTMVADNRLDSIEVIEFLKPGGSLILGVNDVLDLTRAPNEFIGGAHHLDIQGSEMNQVTLVGNWTLESTITSQVYTSQSAEIVIDADVQVFTS